MNCLLIIIIIIIFLFLILIYISYNHENFLNYIYQSDILLAEPIELINTIDVKNKSHDTVIPLNLFMTISNPKNISLNMKNTIDLFMSKNPEFNLYIYSDEDCRNFLKKYFIKDVVDAFDTLIPGAYKADLWRYCVLYYYGGIYQDIKYYPVDKFKYIYLTDKEYFVRDRKEGDYGVYNALLVCKAGNKLLYKCIKQILMNVKTQFYGSSSLEPTGPLLMKKFVTDKDMKNFLQFTKEEDIDYILKDNIKILRSYNEYRNTQIKETHYSYLYKIKKIYNN